MPDPSHDSTLDDVEDELYGVPPDDFVRRRTEAARAARQRGDRDLADEISKLRKPTAAAWALDSFARAHGAAVDALLELGARLRDAIDRGHGDDIRDAMRERAEVVAELMREIRAYTEEHGVPLSAPVASQVEQSLRAAMTSEDDARRLRRGVLTAEIDEPGLGIMEPSSRRTARKDSADGASAAEGTRGARARRDAAEERASIATDAVERGERELDQAVSRRSDLEQEREAVRGRLDEIERQLRDARADEANIESRLRDARSELRAARAAVRRLE